MQEATIKEASREATKEASPSRGEATNATCTTRDLPPPPPRPQCRTGKLVRCRHRRRSENRQQQLRRRRLPAGKCSSESSLPQCHSPARRYLSICAHYCWSSFYKNSQASKFRATRDSSRTRGRRDGSRSRNWEENSEKLAGGKKWEAAGGNREHGKSWEAAGDGKQRKPWENGDEEGMEELASGNPEKRPKTRRQEYRQAS